MVKTTGPSFPTLRGNDFKSNFVITAPPTAAVKPALPCGEFIDPATVFNAVPICPPSASVSALLPSKAVNIAKPAEVDTKGTLIVFFRRVVVFFRRAAIKKLY